MCSMPALFPGQRTCFVYSVAVGLVHFLTCVTCRVEGCVFAWARTAAVLRQRRKAANLYLEVEVCHSSSIMLLLFTTR